MRNMAVKDLVSVGIVYSHKPQTMEWSDKQIKALETEAEARHMYQQSQALRVEFQQESIFIAFWSAMRSGKVKIFRGA